jgi:hypothetical protein
MEKAMDATKAQEKGVVAWDTLTGLDLRRALAEVLGWTKIKLVQGVGMMGARPTDGLRSPVPRWETDEGAALRLLVEVLPRDGEASIRKYADDDYSVIVVHRAIGRGDTLPEAIARCCGAVLEAVNGREG